MIFRDQPALGSGRAHDVARNLFRALAALFGEPGAAE